MKVITVLIFFLTVNFSFAQNADADLNGQAFIGTVTEIPNTDADRLPLVVNETIRFDNGKIYSNLLSRYSAIELPYTSEVDGRRMIALKVILFNAHYSGIGYDNEIDIEISGEVIGDKSLSGIITVKYKDKKEVKFKIEAQNN